MSSNQDLIVAGTRYQKNKMSDTNPSWIEPKIYKRMSRHNLIIA